MCRWPCCKKHIIRAYTDYTAATRHRIVRYGTAPTDAYKRCTHLATWAAGSVVTWANMTGGLGTVVFLASEAYGGGGNLGAASNAGVVAVEGNPLGMAGGVIGVATGVGGTLDIYDDAYSAIATVPIGDVRAMAPNRYVGGSFLLATNSHLVRSIDTSGGGLWDGPARGANATPYEDIPGPIAAGPTGNVLTLGDSFNGSTYDFGATLHNGSTGAVMGTLLIFAGDQLASGSKLCVDGSGNAFVAYYPPAGVGGAQVTRISKMTIAGISWSYDVPGPVAAEVFAICPDGTGGCVVAGEIDVGGTTYGFFRLTSGGTLDWHKRWAKGIATPYALDLDSDGRLWVGGEPSRRTD